MDPLLALSNNNQYVHYECPATHGRKIKREGLCTSTPRKLTPELLCPSHDKVDHTSRQHALDAHLSPIPSPATPFPTAPASLSLALFAFPPEI